MRSGRAQVSLPVVEAVVGALLILAVAGGFVVVGDGDGRAARTAQLDREAADALSLLAVEPFGENRTLDGVLSSESTFGRNRSAVESRLTALFPDGAFFRLETPRGTVGPPRVDGVPAGRSSVVTRYGEVRLWVWYG